MTALRTTSWHATSWLASIALLAIAGCQPESKPAGSETTVENRPAAPLEGRTPDDAYGRPASVSRPTGTWTDPARTQVPAAAQLVVEGATELKFAVPENGWMYIVHPEAGQVYRGAVRRGENVKFDADGVLHVDHKPVWKTVVAKSDTFKIFYKRD